MRGGIGLCWIGYEEPDTTLLQDVAAHLEQVYEHHTRPLRLRERPRHAFDPVRGQHASGLILSWLASQIAAPTDKLLAITDADLFIPVLTFVFGEAQLGGRVALVSTARLRDHAGPEHERVRARLSKEAVHELGHTFGLVHCSPPCVMSRSASLEHIDAKSGDPCADCRERLHQAQAKGDGHD